VFVTSFVTFSMLWHGGSVILSLLLDYGTAKEELQANKVRVFAYVAMIDYNDEGSD
ncbi:hypothetical protein L9F63_020979, partial [Diploptera punctata]